MYSTCLFCTQRLGANEIVEAFPVGRRIAFDGARGRLWVVCSRCERWNLSPIEERWEALEACERAFRETRTRVSTGNIGLARLTEGLELVRIGAPHRPEFAAWRYGDQFGRRRRRTIAYGAAGFGALGIAFMANASIGLLSGTAMHLTAQVAGKLWSLRRRLRLRAPDGRILRLDDGAVRSTRVVPGDGAGQLTVLVGKPRNRTVFEGDDAKRAIGSIVPKLNYMGGSRVAVGDAVSEIEASGGPQEFFDRTIRRTGRTINLLREPQPGEIAGLPPSSRLALEMVLHEETERRALEGELEQLEAAWREAEEIAAISDDLLLPAGARAFLTRHTARRRESATGP